MNSTRRHHPDYLGLREGLADRLLPLLVAAMSFLAVLAIAGTLASAGLAAHWQGDTGSALTIQVPQPADPATGTPGTRLDATLAALRADPEVAAVQVLSADEVNRLLKPWLGADAAALGLTLPAVVSARWNGTQAPGALTAALQKSAPGTMVQSGAEWAARVAALTTSLQTCAAVVLVIVTLIGTAMVAMATRSGLAQRRDTVTLVHGLGALDSDLARRFAARATGLTVAGSVLGVLAALPVLAWLAQLAAPLAGGADGTVLNLPQALWVSLPAVPVVAGLIGWCTTQITVRGWLRNLP
jgi:cell division transport system permease protein